jgi:hypothetical protein
MFHTTVACSPRQGAGSVNQLCNTTDIILTDKAKIQKFSLITGIPAVLFTNLQNSLCKSMQMSYICKLHKLPSYVTSKERIINK